MNDIGEIIWKPRQLSWLFAPLYFYRCPFQPIRMWWWSVSNRRWRSRSRWKASRWWKRCLQWKRPHPWGKSVVHQEWRQNEKFIEDLGRKNRWATQLGRSARFLSCSPCLFRAFRGRSLDLLPRNARNKNRTAGTKEPFCRLANEIKPYIKRT